MRDFIHFFIVCVAVAVIAMTVPAQAAIPALPGDKKVEMNDKSDDEKDKDNKQQTGEEKRESVPVKVNVPVESRVYDGLDVSRHQKDIDWEEVARDKNVKYVYVKATEGATFVDPRYRANIEGARRVGIKVGAYHFLRTGTKVVDQFNNFANTVKKGEQDLIPLLDVEVKQGWTNQQLRDSVKVFLDMLEEHYGCKPMIYTSSSFFNTILGRAFAEYPLFIARYATNEPRLDNGAQWTMWQFSEKGRVKGIDHAVDLSCFNKGRSLRDILIKDNKLNQRKRKTTDVVDKSVAKPASITVKKEAPTMSAQQEKELKKKQKKEQKARERAEKLAQEDAKKKKAEQARKSVQVQQQTKQEDKEPQATDKNSPKPVRRRTSSSNNAQQNAKAAIASYSKFVDTGVSDQEKALEKAEKEAREKAEKEQKAREKAEKAAREKAAKEKATREKQLAKEKAAREKAAKEKAAREKAARERAEREAEAEQARLAAEKAKEEAKLQAIAHKRAQAQAKAQAELEAEAQAEATRKAHQQKKQETKSKLQQQKAASTTVKSQAKSTATPTKKRTNKSSADND